MPWTRKEEAKKGGQRAPAVQFDRPGLVQPGRDGCSCAGYTGKRRIPPSKHVRKLIGKNFTN